MHDWRLLTIFFDWKQGIVIIEVVEYKEVVELKASGVVELFVPRFREWGPSVFINEANISNKDQKGNSTMTIEMQTGDEIRITAEEFILPEGF